MKKSKTKLFFLLMCLLWREIVFAQSVPPPPQTPNIGLYLPEYIPNTWGADFDANWKIIDGLFPGGALLPPIIPRVTVATRPSNPTLNQVIVITDAASGTSCDVGGGSTQIQCQWTGAAWVVISGSGGSGGGSFAGVTTGTNVGQTLTVGNSSSLVATGTGTIAATTAITATSATTATTATSAATATSASTATTAATATALAANGTNCSARQAAVGVDASGNAEGCFDAGHTIQDEGTPLTQRPTMNFTGAGVTTTDAGGITVVNIPGGAGTTFTTVGTGVNTSSVMTCGTGCQILTSGTGTITPQYTPSGNISATTVQGAITELDVEKQPVDADLTALAANTTAGFWAAATNIARIFQNGTGIAWTNPAGIAGNPQANVTSTVVMTDRANTWTTGDQNMAGAASFTPPSQTGAAPTGPGRIAWDSTGLRMKYGNGTLPFTFAHLAEIQPINSNLTGISGLTPTGTEARIPYVDSTGVWRWFQKVICINSGGNVIHTSSLSPLTETCDTGAGGTLSGTLTATKVPLATGASTLADSVISQSGGNVTIAGGLIVNCTTDCISLDFSAYATHTPYSIPILYGNVATGLASIPVTVGARTSGNVVTWNADGALVSGGAPGTGTWNDTSTNTGSNKTLVAVGAGGTNTITIPIVASFDGGSLSATSGCQTPVLGQINSGPNQYYISCSTPATAQFSAVLIGIKQAVGTFTVTLHVNDTASAARHFAGTFKAMCRAAGTTVNATWGTAQTVDITMTTANITYQGTTAAITANGTCSANADLYLQFDANGSMTDTGTARVLGLTINQVS